MKKSQRRRLHVLCEDRLHQQFVERLADRWGIGPRQRQIDASPAARGSASDYVLKNYVDAVARWRSQRHENVILLIVVDGDDQGVVRRRNELATQLKDAHSAPIDATDPVAIIVPTWHIETWIAWLCGHRPINEQTKYKRTDVDRKIESGEYSARMAIDAWEPPTSDETAHVPSLTDARAQLRRLDV